MSTFPYKTLEDYGLTEQKQKSKIQGLALFREDLATFVRTFDLNIGWLAHKLEKSKTVMEKYLMGPNLNYSNALVERTIEVCREHLERVEKLELPLENDD